MKTLEIKTLNVSIHVIRVDNHKMTKAAFSQIVDKKLFYLDDDNTIKLFRHDEILGWVNKEDGLWWLYTYEGKLLKDIIINSHSISETRYMSILDSMEHEVIHIPCRDEDMVFTTARIRKSSTDYNSFIEKMTSEYPQLFIAT